MKEMIYDTISIGNYIKGLREDRDLTQEQAAADMGISRKVLGEWERGDRRLADVDDLNMLAEYYSVDFIVFCQFAIRKGSTLHTHVDRLSIEIARNGDNLRRIVGYAQDIIKLVDSYDN